MNRANAFALRQCDRRTGFSDLAFRTPASSKVFDATKRPLDGTAICAGIEPLPTRNYGATNEQ